METTNSSFASHFSALEDPRVDRTKRHLLQDIVTIAICAVLCGADGWVSVALFGQRQEAWLRTFLRLPNGIPSHDTFGRVFSALDPDAFRQCFINWVAAVSPRCEREIVAVDGKTLRRSFDHASDRSAIHMVNAWASAAGISLGQLATEEKSNEITAIPRLLEMLAVQRAVVTTDAMGCQKAIAKKIVDKEADYVLALKGNQGSLHDEVTRLFDWASQGGPDAPELSYRETVDGDHGRIEIRRYWVSDDVTWFAERGDWLGLRSFAMAQAERTRGGKTSIETRYFISSLPGASEELICQAIRRHWSVENNLHWVLDVAFREDECRIRNGHGAENLAIVRQIALNLLKQENTAKVGVANKRLLAGWDEDYLMKVLGF